MPGSGDDTLTRCAGGENATVKADGGLGRKADGRGGWDAPKRCQCNAREHLQQHRTGSKDLVVVLACVQWAMTWPSVVLVDTKPDQRRNWQRNWQPSKSNGV